MITIKTVFIVTYIFPAPTGDLGTEPPQIWGSYCTFIPFSYASNMAAEQKQVTAAPWKIVSENEWLLNDAVSFAVGSACLSYSCLLRLFNFLLYLKIKYQAERWTSSHPIWIYLEKYFRQLVNSLCLTVSLTLQRKGIFEDRIIKSCKGSFKKKNLPKSWGPSNETKLFSKCGTWRALGSWRFHTISWALSGVSCRLSHWPCHVSAWDMEMIGSVDTTAPKGAQSRIEVSSLLLVKEMAGSWSIGPMRKGVGFRRRMAFSK